MNRDGVSRFFGGLILQYENVEQTARNVMNYQECSLYDIEHGIINACDEVKM